MEIPFKRNDPFVGWLIENVEAIERGVAFYRGFPVHRETQFAQYSWALSVFVVSFKLPSRYYVVGHESTSWAAFLYSALSFALGWWGFPFGPIFTILAIVGNLSGGDRRSVGDLIDDLKGHRRDIVTLTDEAARLARALIAERGFPPGTALFVGVNVDRDPRYVVEFDLPDSDGRQWVSNSQGLAILVDKSTAKELEGLVIDCENGSFVFHRDTGLHRN